VHGGGKDVNCVDSKKKGRTVEGERESGKRGNTRKKETQREGDHSVDQSVQRKRGAVQDNNVGEK